MKLIFIIILITNITFDSIKSEENYELSAVTYTFSGGRFGDNLIAYLHAKWISHFYNIPLLYKPFEYSDKLTMHETEIHYKDCNLSKFKNIIEFKKGSNLNIDRYAKTLYIIPYFPESISEHQPPDPGPHISNCGRYADWFYFQTDWNDKEFIKEINKLIAPIKPLSLIVPTQNNDTLNIAIHVRKNSIDFDYDSLDGLPEEKYDPHAIYMDVTLPLKHICDRYYIEQIKYLTKLYKDKKFYVFIFTNDPKPDLLAEKFKKEINNDQVIFDYRKNKTNDYSNVLEDYFSMAYNFDCLIRSESNFALTASKLRPPTILIYPLHHKWVARDLYIDKVQIVTNP